MRFESRKRLFYRFQSCDKLLLSLVPEVREGQIAKNCPLREIEWLHQRHIGWHHRNPRSESMEWNKSSYQIGLVHSGTYNLWARKAWGTPAQTRKLQRLPMRKTRTQIGSDWTLWQTRWTFIWKGSNALLYWREPYTISRPYYSLCGLNQATRGTDVLWEIGLYSDIEIYFFTNSKLADARRINDLKRY